VTDSSQIKTNRRTVSLALNLMPYAGISLWYIGGIRGHPSDKEDRLFSTIFLGSGLLFLVLTFVGAAVAGGLLDIYTLESSFLVNGGFSAYSRAVVYQIITIHVIRNSDVFMISLGTIWIRTG